MDYRIDINEVEVFTQHNTKEYCLGPGEGNVCWQMHSDMQTLFLGIHLEWKTTWLFFFTERKCANNIETSSKTYGKHKKRV